VTDEELEALPRTRAEARAAGAMLYFTGKLCRAAHVAARYVSSGHCVECGTARQKAYHDANREKVLAREKARYEANREKVLVRQKAYYEANREKMLAYQKAYRAANREKDLARKKAYRQRVQDGVLKLLGC